MMQEHMTKRLSLGSSNYQLSSIRDKMTSQQESRISENEESDFYAFEDKYEML